MPGPSLQPELPFIVLSEFRYSHDAVAERLTGVQLQATPAERYRHSLSLYCQMATSLACLSISSPCRLIQQGQHLIECCRITSPHVYLRTFRIVHSANGKEDRCLCCGKIASCPWHFELAGSGSRRGGKVLDKGVGPCIIQSTREQSCLKCVRVGEITTRQSRRSPACCG